MKQIASIWTVVFLLGLSVFPAAAQQGTGGAMDQGAPPRGMMMQKGGGTGMMGQNMGRRGQMCTPYSQGDGMGMMGGRMRGEMHEMMGGMGMMRETGPTFYLDMKDELALTPQQVRQLRDIRRDFRKDFIRRRSELKIALIDMEDEFQGDWSVEEAEKQLRQIQLARTDMLVRYLKARKEAEQVLTAEQLQKVRDLFEDDGYM